MDRYFILLGSIGLDSDAFERTRRELSTEGLELRATWESVLVFVTDQTSVLNLPGGGVVIGEVYTRNGERLQEDLLAQVAPTCRDLIRHLLNECWGDYVAIRPAENAPGLSVTRSPSHACGLECLYSLRGGMGFVTSDVTLGYRLGLLERRVDFQSIACRLMFPDLKTRTTGLEGITELLPGSSLHASGRTSNVIQDWSPWSFVASPARRTERPAAAAAVRQAVDMVVNTWAGRDRSVLLELSGGLDSSIVGVALGAANVEVSCATLTSTAPGADELDYAALVASAIGAPLEAIEIGFDDAKFDFAIAPRAAVPVVGPLQFAVDLLMQRHADRVAATSIFSGAGGDTVFAYLPNAAPAADAFRARGLFTGLNTLRDLSAFHQCTWWKAARLTMRQVRQPPQILVELDRAFVASHQSPSLPEPTTWLQAPADALQGDRLRIFGLSTALFFQQSCPRGLSRPLRMPLLSQPVIEACLRVPGWMWFAGGHNRSVARDAYAGRLPETVRLRKSKGSLSGYLGALFRRRGNAMLDFLIDGELTAHGILDADALRAYRIQPGGPISLDYMRIFRLCAVENWVRRQRAFASRY